MNSILYSSCIRHSLEEGLLFFTYLFLKQSSFLSGPWNGLLVPLWKLEIEALGFGKPCSQPYRGLVEGTSHRWQKLSVPVLQWINGAKP